MILRLLSLGDALVWIHGPPTRSEKIRQGGNKDIKILISSRPAVSVIGPSRVNIRVCNIIMHCAWNVWAVTVISLPERCLSFSNAVISLLVLSQHLVPFLYKLHTSSSSSSCQHVLTANNYFFLYYGSILMMFTKQLYSVMLRIKVHSFAWIGSVPIHHAMNAS